MNTGTMDLQFSNQTGFCGLNNRLTVYAYGSDNNIKKALTAYNPYENYVDLEKTSKAIFVPNGAEGRISVNDVTSGQEYVLPNNNYHKEGFTFVGWSDGTTVCNPGDTYTMPETGGIIFTTEWAKVEPLTILATSSIVGNKVTFTAKGAGGLGNYTYKFNAYNKDTNAWGLLQDFSSIAYRVTSNNLVRSQQHLVKYRVVKVILLLLMHMQRFSRNCGKKCGYECNY